MTHSHVRCTICRHRIGLEDLNVAEGVAFCRRCTQLSRLGDIAFEEELLYDEDSFDDRDPDPRDPPHGCSVTQGIDGTIIRATDRDTSLEDALLPIAVPGLIVSIAAGAVSAGAAAAPPSPPARPAAVAADRPDAWIEAWAVLAPTVLLMSIMVAVLSSFVIGRVLIAVLRRTEVRIRPGEVVVRTGGSPLDFHEPFDPARVKAIRPLPTRTWLGRDIVRIEVKLHAVPAIRLAARADRARLRWLLHTLRMHLDVHEHPPGDRSRIDAPWR